MDDAPVEVTEAPPDEPTNPPWTVQDLAARRSVVVHYDPSDDAVTVDGEGCSPLEIRGILELALEELDYTPVDTEE